MYYRHKTYIKHNDMSDYLFKRLLIICCIFILLICAGMVYSLVSGAFPAFHHYGFLNFIGTADWNPHPDNETYGALSFIIGTLLTSFSSVTVLHPVFFARSPFYRRIFQRQKNSRLHQLHH